MNANSVSPSLDAIINRSLVLGRLFLLGASLWFPFLFFLGRRRICQGQLPLFLGLLLFDRLPEPIQAQIGLHLLIPVDQLRHAAIVEEHAPLEQLNLLRPFLRLLWRKESPQSLELRVRRHLAAAALLLCLTFLVRRRLILGELPFSPRQFFAPVDNELVQIVR